MSLNTWLSAVQHLNKAPLANSPLTLKKYPHKPILLLAVLDLIAAGYYDRNRFYLSPELNDLFDRYWRIACPALPTGDITMPFKKLESDGFWHLTDERHPITRSRVARFEDALYRLTLDPASRAALQATLIDSHFAPEIRGAMRQVANTSEEALRYADALLRRIDFVKEAPAPAVRSQAFRALVVRAYDYRCAVCGIRIFSREGRTVVEAAHIKPWSLWRDDEADNGLSLCRLCHWSFDAGVVSVSDDYLVLTSKHLLSDRNLGGHLIATAQRPIILPENETLLPARAKLQWHREKVFVR